MYQVRSTIFSLAAAVLVQCLPAGAAAAPKENPDIEDYFKEGMAALEEDRLATAIEKFRNILVIDPSLDRARLELALAYHRTLRYEEAERLAQQVLDDPLTPPDVRVTVLAFVAQVKRDSEIYGQKNQFTPFVMGGFMRDSNVNVGPTTADIRIGDVDQTLTQQSLKQADNAYVLNTGIDHLYQSGKRVQIGERTGMLLWQSGASAYSRQYNNASDYDMVVASLNTGPAILMLRHWRASLQLQTDYMTLGDKALGWFHSVKPSMTWQQTDSEFTWDANYTRRFYHQDIDKDREGDYLTTGLSGGRYFDNRRVVLSAGARVIKLFADDDQYGYKGFQVNAGVSTDTYRNGSAYARAQYGYYDYDGKDAIAQKAREEDEYIATLGLSHEYNEPGDLLKGWVANLFWERTENDSNIGQLYSYKRYQGMVSLSRNF